MSAGQLVQLASGMDFAHGCCAAAAIQGSMLLNGFLSYLIYGNHLFSLGYVKAAYTGKKQNKQQQASPLNSILFFSKADPLYEFFYHIKGERILICEEWSRRSRRRAEIEGQRFYCRLSLHPHDEPTVLLHW